MRLTSLARWVHACCTPFLPARLVKQRETINPFAPRCSQGGFRGDPASALLEVLDPEQNKAFNDHYLDVPMDLSKVLFMCTANVLDTIPGPLLDRMEVIRLSGYIREEKVQIARRYLEPEIRRETGVGDRGSLTDGAVHRLIEDYCREAGVRNLKNQMEKIYRKLALRIVQPSPAAKGEAESATEAEAPQLVVDATDLEGYVGQPVFQSDKIFKDRNPVGVVTGLAWTAMGGSTLYIESAVVERAEGKGGLRTTGQLGDVMKESATIAHTFARAFLARLDPGNKFFSEAALHVHVPAGAVPKDGPSAGCTIITAMLSLALNRPTLPDIAMTGEVTVTGKVLPIGGVKEKCLAARRTGIRRVILPDGNRRDWDEVPAEVKQDIEAVFVEDYRQVFQAAFGEEAPAEVTQPVPPAAAS